MKTFHNSKGIVFAHLAYYGLTFRPPKKGVKLTMTKETILEKKGVYAPWEDDLPSELPRNPR